MSVNSAAASAGRRDKEAERGGDFEREDLADLKDGEGDLEMVGPWARGRGRLCGFVVVDCSMRMKSRKAAVAWAE